MPLRFVEAWVFLGSLCVKRSCIRGRAPGGERANFLAPFLLGYVRTFPRANSTPGELFLFTLELHSLRFSYLFPEPLWGLVTPLGAGRHPQGGRGGWKSHQGGGLEKGLSSLAPWCWSFFAGV